MTPFKSTDVKVFLDYWASSQIPMLILAVENKLEFSILR